MAKSTVKSSVKPGSLISREDLLRRMEAIKQMPKIYIVEFRPNLQSIHGGLFFDVRYLVKRTMNYVYVVDEYGCRERHLRTKYGVCTDVHEAVDVLRKLYADQKAKQELAINEMAEFVSEIEAACTAEYGNKSKA